MTCLPLLQDHDNPIFLRTLNKGYGLALNQEKIPVCYFDQPGLRDKEHISIGSLEENKKLLAAIRGYLGSVARVR